MAYTTFQKTFWSDDYILNLSKDEKLAYCYLISNDKTQQCGIYELAMAKACLELSMRPEELLICLKKFSDDKKICYSMETQEICVINWLKHNSNSSWKTMESVRKQLMNLKNPQLMLLLYDPREPLFNGTRKEKQPSGEYIEKPFVIENPFMEYFKELSDSQLLEIRTPYIADKLQFMPLASHIEGASAINITRTEHNKNITRTRTETLDQKPHSEWRPPTPEENMSNRVQQIINYWNQMDNLPNCRYQSINVPSLSDFTEKLSIFSVEEIQKAIFNLASYWESEDAKFRPSTISAFIRNSFDRWTDEASPWSRYDNSQNDFSREEAERMAAEAFPIRGE